MLIVKTGALQDLEAEGNIEHIGTNIIRLGIRAGAGIIELVVLIEKISEVIFEFQLDSIRQLNAGEDGIIKTGRP